MMTVCVARPRSDQAMELVGVLAELAFALALLSMFKVESRLWVEVGRGMESRERTGGVRVMEGVVTARSCMEAVSGSGRGYNLLNK